MPDQLIENLERIRPDDLLVVFRFELLGDLTGESSLVVFLFLEADRAGGHRPIHEVAHHGHNGGRVHSAAEEGAERYIAHQPYASGLAQAVAQDFAPLLLAALFDLAEGDVPVTHFANAVGRGHQIMAWENLARGTVYR